MGYRIGKNRDIEELFGRDSYLSVAFFEQEIRLK